MTVAAVAGGAAVAAGQTVANAFGLSAALAPDQTDGYTKLAASAMLPVSELARPTADADPSSTAIGGDQLRGSGAATALDPGEEVDVANLTKATRMQAKAAQQERTVSAATAHGAPEGSVYDDTTYVLPTAGQFTSGFGGRWGVTHYGIDLAAPIGTPIYALTDAVVERSGPASGFGLWVVLRHTDGTHSVYGHINRSLVEVGQKVKAGDQIAEVGNRGQSTGPHLHLEVWEQSGKKINPLPWLAERGIDVTGPAKAEAEQEAADAPTDSSGDKA